MYIAEILTRESKLKLKQPIVKAPWGSSSFVSLDLEEGSLVIDIRKQL